MKSRRSYTAAEKLLVLNYAEINGNRATSRHFSIPEANIRLWRAKKETIQTLPSQKKANRGFSTIRYVPTAI